MGLFLVVGALGLWEGLFLKVVVRLGPVVGAGDVNFGLWKGSMLDLPSPLGSVLRRFGHELDLLSFDDLLFLVLGEWVDFANELLLVLFSGLHVLRLMDFLQIAHILVVLCSHSRRHTVTHRVEAQWRSPVLSIETGFLVKLVPLLHLDLLGPRPAGLVCLHASHWIDLLGFRLVCRLVINGHLLYRLWLHVLNLFCPWG